MAGEIEPVADQLDRGDRCLDGHLLQMADARRHRPHDLRVEMRARHDQLMEITWIEPRDTRGLVGAQIGDRRRAEQQRHLAHIIAGPIRVDRAFDAADVFGDGDAT